MKVSDLFETRVAEKIEPVIKVGETADESKLANEIGSYVVTPLIERCLDDFLEHYTDTFLKNTTEIGVWISGYFGSGKSHLAKIMGMLAENRSLNKIRACERFIPRIPQDAPLRDSIIRNLKSMDRCETRVLAFNINTLADSRSTPLPKMLLTQYYISQGYSSNLLYAKVIEAELDKHGKLDALHNAVETRTKRPWSDIKQNMSFYKKFLYEAVCEVAGDVFSTPQDVENALKEAETGELFNVSFLIDTVLKDLSQHERKQKKAQRLIWVLDESGQWIENNTGRLAQLQALVEEAATKGQGKIWLVVTTHGDMGSIYTEAHALDGDMKKIEGRFRFKPALTTENIELVLEERLFKKNRDGKLDIENLYNSHSGVLRGIGELSNTSQNMPPCTLDKFVTYYPFFPYQVHLLPEIVKTIRSKGGRGEQMSGSTRTLLAITQDILRVGRRNYLDQEVGVMVSFDEVYNNLCGGSEISPDIRTDISKIKDVVKGGTESTTKVAEILYLIRELAYIPRTIDNLARLLVETAEEDIPTVIARISPELERLMGAKLVAKIGEEYEFLTGEKRSFEEDIGTIETQYKQQDRETGFKDFFIYDSGNAYWRNWLKSDVVNYHNKEFNFKLIVDDISVARTQGYVTLKLFSPLAVLGGSTLQDAEKESMGSGEQNTIYFVSSRIQGFDRDLTRFLAMKEIIEKWKGDPSKPDEARKLVQEKDSNDLPKLEKNVIEGIKDGIRMGHIVFRGASRSITVSSNQTPGDALRAEMAEFLASIFTKFDKVPVQVSDDQKAIQEVLIGGPSQLNDVKALKIYDKEGKIDLNAPLLDAIRMLISTEQVAKRRVLGRKLIENFTEPPYGWDSNAIRIGVAALVRTGVIKILINEKSPIGQDD